MSQTTCPNGHVSADPDWCDTCGARLGSAGSPGVPDAAAPVPMSSPPDSPGSPAAAPTGSTSSAGNFSSVPCPHCSAPNASDALFCEDCGYDFTTGQAPEPVPTGTVPVVNVSTVAGAVPTSVDPLTDAMPPAPAPTGWIVIVEIDPVWFELKGTLADQPCPAPSTSTIPLRHAIVRIGRSSQSRGIHPEIAMDSDTAVSRQHAQLVAVSANGSQADADSAALPDAFAAVDLGSTNGTFVVRSGTEPSEAIEPIDPGVAITLADGDRVYIGAWSRLTIRHTGA